MYEDWHVKDFQRMRVPPPSPDPPDKSSIPPRKRGKFCVLEEAEDGALRLIELTPAILARILGDR